MKNPNRIIPAAITLGYPHPSRDGEGNLIQGPAVIISGPELGGVAEHRAALKELQRGGSGGSRRVHSDYFLIEVWTRDGLALNARFQSPERSESREKTMAIVRASDAQRLAERLTTEADRLTDEAADAKKRADAAKKAAKAAEGDLKGALKDGDLTLKDLNPETNEQREARIEKERADALAAKQAAKDKETREQEEAKEKAHEAASAHEGDSDRLLRDRLHEIACTGSSNGNRFTKRGEGLLAGLAQRLGISLGGGEKCGELIEAIAKAYRNKRIEQFGTFSDRVSGLLSGKLDLPSPEVPSDEELLGPDAGGDGSGGEGDGSGGEKEGE